MKMKKKFNSSNVASFKEIVVSSRLAEKLANSDKTIEAKDVNRFLAFAGIKITEDKLKDMLNIKRLEFNNLNLHTTKSKNYLDNLGTYRGKIQIPGVYI